MKMPSLKQKITRPYVVLIIAVQLFVLMVFNVLVSRYSYNQAEENLSKSAIRLEQDALIANGDVNVNNEIPPIMLLNMLRQGDNTRVILSENGEFTDHPRPGETRLPENVIQQASEMTNKANDREIVSFYQGGEYYHAMKMDISILSEGQTAIYISAGYFADGFVEAVNTFMVVILLFSVIVFVIVSQKLAKGISHPIQKITNTVKKMKNIELVNVDENQKSIELKELAVEINDMNERIYNYDKKQKAFLQNASHELRTPLTSIQGYAEGMIEGVFEDKEKCIGIILEETKRLTKIVDDILSLARIENFDGKYINSKVNLCDFIVNCTTAITGLCTKNNKEIILNLPQNDIYINANDELLKQSITHLLSNAVRHAKNKIRIAVITDNKEVIVSICDDGKGISESDLPHIFERFYKGKDGNFGLGLCVAKSAIEHMNGELIANNGEIGAEFVIKLKEN